MLNAADEAKAALVEARTHCGDEPVAITNINRYTIEHHSVSCTITRLCISREMAKVEKLLKKYEGKERKMAARMFGGGGFSTDADNADGGAAAKGRDSCASSSGAR